MKSEYNLVEKLFAIICALSVFLIPLGVLLFFLFTMTSIGILSAFALGYSWTWIVTNIVLIIDIMLFVVTPITFLGWIFWIVIVNEYKKILYDRIWSCKP